MKMMLFETVKEVKDNMWANFPGVRGQAMFRALDHLDTLEQAIRLLQPKVRVAYVVPENCGHIYVITNINDTPCLTWDNYFDIDVEAKEVKTGHTRPELDNE